MNKRHFLQSTFSHFNSLLRIKQVWINGHRVLFGCVNRMLSIQDAVSSTYLTQSLRLHTFYLAYCFR